MRSPAMLSLLVTLAGCASSEWRWLAASVALRDSSADTKCVQRALSSSAYALVCGQTTVFVRCANIDRVNCCWRVESEEEATTPWVSNMHSLEGKTCDSAPGGHVSAPPHGRGHRR